MTGCRWDQRRRRARRRTHSFVQINESSAVGEDKQWSEDSVEEEYPSRRNIPEIDGTEEFEQSLLELSSRNVVCDWRTPRTWKAVPATSDVSVKPTTDVIHLADVEYIRVFKEQVVKSEMSLTTLEIKLTNSNDSLKIYGGMYLPDFAHEFAMDIFWPKGDMQVPKDEFGIFVSDPAVWYNPGKGEHDPAQMPARRAQYRVSSLYQFLDQHIQEGNSLPSRAQGAGAMVGGFVLGQMGAVAGAVGGMALGVALGPAAVPLAFVGFIGGFALPFGSIMWKKSSYDKADAQRELRLLASEKIFEKMRCHQLFQRCGGVAIAPKQGHCPY
jgi:hypothetical protein